MCGELCALRCGELWELRWGVCGELCALKELRKLGSIVVATKGDRFNMEVGDTKRDGDGLVKRPPECGDGPESGVRFSTAEGEKSVCAVFGDISRLLEGE